MFGGQSSNNVHDVRMVFLETTLSVISCFVEFYVFVLDEIDMRGPKFIHKHIRVLNVQVKVPKEQQRVLEEEPFT